MPDRELERELNELRGFIEYPPTPDVARAARRVLDEDENRRPRRFLTALPAMRWVAVAAAFVLVVAVPTLSPGLRATASGCFWAECVHNAAARTGGYRSTRTRTEGGTT